MTVFYRKYRPQKLAEIVGQEHIKKTLLAQLQSGKIGHGYLFSGPRGTGKTSTARILAKAVNCQSRQLTIEAKPFDSAQGKQLTKKGQMSGVKGQTSFGEPCNKCQSCIAITNGSHLDLIEIDAASNRGIDEIRDLREKIKLSPISARFKVYIIDEAHMLTTEAFNALLKTLEEPPVHAIFILCTTDVQKLPPTVISRLLRFNFSRATPEEIVQAIEGIAKSEGIKIEREANLAIADAADGSFRDAISILDQVSAASGTISKNDVVRLANILGWNQLYTFVGFLVKKDLKQLVLTIEQIATGGDISFFAREVILFLEKLLFIKIGVARDLDIDQELAVKMRDLASQISQSELERLMKIFLITEGEMKLYPLAKIAMVLAVCKYCEVGELGKKIIDQDSKLEKQDATKLNKIINKNNVQKSPEFLEGIEKHWSEFLNKVKPVNTHVVALLRSTRPYEFDGVNLGLEVFYRFHKEKLEEPKINLMLEEILSGIIGSPVRIKFVLANRETKQPSVVSASDVIDINQEDLEKIAQEIFSK